MKSVILFLKYFFSFFKLILILFPIFTFIYFISKRSLKRFFLFFGTFLIFIGKLIMWFSLIHKPNYDQTGQIIFPKETIFLYIDSIFVWIGLLIIMISFIFIVKEDWESRNMSLCKYFRDFSFKNIILFIGLASMIAGFFITFIYLSQRITHKPLAFMNNLFSILISLDQFLIIIGSFITIIGFLWIIFDANVKSLKKNRG